MTMAKSDHLTDSETETPLDAAVALSVRAFSLAAFGSAAYLLKHCPEFAPNTPAHEEIHSALVPALKAAVRDALPAALDDAREALAANMEVIALTTFGASMRLAGIAAAKAALVATGRHTAA